MPKMVKTVEEYIQTVFEYILPRSLPFLAWTGWGKSFDITEKSALKLVKLPNLKVVRLKRAKI